MAYPGLKTGKRKSGSKRGPTRKVGFWQVRQTGRQVCGSAPGVSGLPAACLGALTGHGSKRTIIGVTVLDVYSERFLPSVFCQALCCSRERSRVLPSPRPGAPIHQGEQTIDRPHEQSCGWAAGGGQRGARKRWGIHLDKEV